MSSQSLKAEQSGIRARQWVRGSTPHAQDDELNDSTQAAAFVRVDASGGASRATWTEAGDCMSLLLNGGDAVGELHALMKPYVLAVGESIETYMVTAGPASNYPHGGIIVADGVTYGSGLQEYLNYFNTGSGGAISDPSPSEWSGYNTRTAQTDSSFTGWGTALFLRLKRSATSTWQHFGSPDGISWVQIGADRTLAMTPSHIGFAGGTFGGSGKMVFSFDYLRVV